MDPSRGNGSFLFPPSAMKTTTRSNWIEDRWLEVQCHEKEEPYMLRFFKRNKQKQDFYVRSDSTIGKLCPDKGRTKFSVRVNPAFLLGGGRRTRFSPIERWNPVREPQLCDSSPFCQAKRNSGDPFPPPPSPSQFNVNKFWKHRNETKACFDSL